MIFLTFSWKSSDQCCTAVSYTHLLNEALKDFTGALLFTSQDHQFVQTTANRIMEITPNGLIDKECTYDEYLENDEAARKRQIVEIEEDDE